MNPVTSWGQSTIDPVGFVADLYAFIQWNNTPERAQGAQVNKPESIADGNHHELRAGFDAGIVPELSRNN